MPTPARTYTSAYFALDLDGVKCGFLKSVDGGGVYADVVEERAGSDPIVRKHLAGVKYEDLLLALDLSLEKPVYDWIAAAWNGKPVRKDVDLLEADAAYQIRRQREFFHVLIAETTIPAMDASSKEPCYLTLKLAPEHSRSQKGSGKLAGSTGKGSQKRWLASNFRLQIDGLDCTRVSRVDAFTLKQTLVTNAVGDLRDYLKEPGKLEVPNLKVSLLENFAQSFVDWHEDFVIKGNCDQDREKNGSLTFLAPDLKAELARINFFNLGIFRLAPEKYQPGQVQKLSAEMYCERMEFVFP